jgi:hypothetical protein
LDCINRPGHYQKRTAYPFSGLVKSPQKKPFLAVKNGRKVLQEFYMDFENDPILGY